jgi:hypothetical protein
MEQRSNDAALKDAQINLIEEECVKSMGHRLSTNGVELKDARIKSSMEECASDMEQRSSCAALKVAQISPNEEEYARDTAHTAIPMMNLQLSHRVWDQILIRLL